MKLSWVLWSVVAGWSSPCVVNCRGGGQSGGMESKHTVNFPIMLLRVAGINGAVRLKCGCNRAALLSFLCSWQTNKMPKGAQCFPSVIVCLIFCYSLSCFFLSLLFFVFSSSWSWSSGVQSERWGERDTWKRNTETKRGNNAKTVIKASLILYTLLHHLHTPTTSFTVWPTDWWTDRSDSTWTLKPSIQKPFHGH